MLRSWGRVLRTLLALLGGLMVLVTLAPPYWYALKLAGQWADPQGATLIVLSGDVLDNGVIGLTSYWRAVYASIAWKQGHFQNILLSGDQKLTNPMRDFLVASGVPKEDIAIEGRSISTRENAIFTAQVARNYPAPYVLLTSDYHMYRAHRAFSKAGLPVVPRPFPEALKRMNDWRLRWTVFIDLMQESAKILYYWARGWI